VTRPRTETLLALAALGSLLGGVGWLAVREARVPTLCADGMIQLGARCCGEGQRLEYGACRGEPSRCSRVQRATPEGCVAHEGRVRLDGGRVERRPTDWDDRSQAPASLEVDTFRIDVHEVTEAEYLDCVRAGVVKAAPRRGEPGLPQTGVTATDAARCCAHRGGALPTTAELAFAAMGRAGRRYPWGDAGAVCRRVAHGLVDGPCAHGSRGPQLAGSHPSGATPEGLLDLAGNVEEWARTPAGFEARGGSYRDASVTALRTFSARVASDDDASDARGFRCVYAEFPR